MWEGQHFFLREIKKYFSKDFGVGGSAFFSLEKKKFSKDFGVEGQHFFP